jgi:hypothetical protein
MPRGEEVEDALPQGYRGVQVALVATAAAILVKCLSMELLSVLTDVMTLLVAFSATKIPPGAMDERWPSSMIALLAIGLLGVLLDGIDCVYALLDPGPWAFFKSSCPLQQNVEFLDPFMVDYQKSSVEVAAGSYAVDLNPCSRMSVISNLGMLMGVVAQLLAVFAALRVVGVPSLESRFAQNEAFDQNAFLQAQHPTPQQQTTFSPFAGEGRRMEDSDDVEGGEGNFQPFQGVGQNVLLDSRIEQQS